ncbi:MAG: biotin-dependent carboxyltransferase family protein [Thiobacillaceae bacterium]
MRLHVIRAGLLDTVQDLGRPGYRHFGVPQSGAADQNALILANRLVGNEDGAAGLEFTFRGPKLGFPEGGVVALAGARFESNGADPSGGWNQTRLLAAGETLDLGQALDGYRGYLAIGGGLGLPRVLGSRATFLAGGFGGLGGRALWAGDELPVGDHGLIRMGRAASVAETGPIRVVAGPQLRDFSDAALISLLCSDFRVESSLDRAGIRLNGAPLKRSHQTRLPSQGVLPGAIQVPPDGQPIILGWDGPVTGGYPVIAGVICTDLGRIAQLRPGDRLRFTALSPEDARDAWNGRRRALSERITWLA